jgi:DNA-directed RNA polymerase subunit RPC12/RpoP
MKCFYCNNEIESHEITKIANPNLILNAYIGEKEKYWYVCENCKRHIYSMLILDLNEIIKKIDLKEETE